ncbi:MAG: protein translocase subunit SecD [Ilumatobacteraceae bacterium]
MRRRLWTSLIGVVLIVIIALGANIATGNTPILGLDLQGGVSVILAPVEPASQDDLLVIRDLIRDELERQGIAEPDVRVQGQTIVVDLPGVRDQQEALDAVDVSGVVELRPVLNFSSCPEPDADSPVLGLGDDATTDDGVPVDTTPTGPVAPDTNEAPATSVEPAGFRSAVPDPTIPVDTVPEPIPTDLDLTTATVPDTGNEFLPSRDGAIVCVGPAQGTGEVFSKGSAELTADAGWGVAVELRSDGQATWNSLATQCYNMEPTCPSTQPGVRGQIAIVLDSVVQSSPQVNQPNFTDSVAITGSFTRSEAEGLVAVLNRGAFPVEVEAQEARTVSASAGSDSLQAAIIAGLMGMALVVVFLIAYYRWLALVIVGGLVVWGMMVFSMASLVSGWTNYALSLAGVTGIIVAVGVTVDSYVVFFERIKDELRSGRTIKNASPRSFGATWRTIWSADLVSLIGALILFWLSVGSVRGFALYLGLTTICDLLVCYFFTRPAVLLLSRSKLMARQKSVLGMKVATS